MTLWSKFMTSHILCQINKSKHPLGLLALIGVALAESGNNATPLCPQYGSPVDCSPHYDDDEVQLRSNSLILTID